MTLNTKVYVHDEVEIPVIFRKAQELIKATGARTEDREWFGDKERCLMNKPMQGFDAWLMVKYREGGPLRAEPEGHDEDCEPDCSWPHAPAHYCEVSFDTAYSYSGPEGGCGALHARLLFELGQWLDERDIDWSWRNKFPGEVWPGEDRSRRPTDLVALR